MQLSFWVLDEAITFQSLLVTPTMFKVFDSYQDLGFSSLWLEELLLRRFDF